MEQILNDVEKRKRTYYMWTWTICELEIWLDLHYFPLLVSTLDFCFYGADRSVIFWGSWDQVGQTRLENREAIATLGCWRKGTRVSARWSVEDLDMEAALRWVEKGSQGVSRATFDIIRSYRNNLSCLTISDEIQQIPINAMMYLHYMQHVTSTSFNIHMFFLHCCDSSRGSLSWGTNPLMLLPCGVTTLLSGCSAPSQPWWRVAWLVVSIQRTHPRRRHLRWRTAEWHGPEMHLDVLYNTIRIFMI